LPFGHRKIMPDQGNGPFDHVWRARTPLSRR
jgi:hypothetical protein